MVFSSASLAVRVTVKAAPACGLVVLGAAVKSFRAPGLTVMLALVPLTANLTDSNVRRWLPLLRIAGTRLGRVLTADWFRQAARGR